MSKELFKLTSLNLNGIRSASSKGLAAWIEKSQPHCICVQEVKAQYEDVKDKFEEIAGMKGYFHFAEKKGYSGVGVYTKETPTEVIVGIGNTPRLTNSTLKAAMWSCVLTRRRANSPSSAATTPAARRGRSGSRRNFGFWR